MFDKVLVPVDLNEKGFSDKAVTMACGLLKDGGHLHLLKVMPGYQMPIVGSFFPEDAFDDYLTEAKKTIDEFAGRVMEGQPFSYTTHVVEGKAAREIIKQVTETKSEAIVMASHKRSKLDNMMIGSIATKVLGKSSVPVMIVKP